MINSYVIHDAVRYRIFLITFMHIQTVSVCSFFIINIMMCFTLCIYVCVQQAAHAINWNVDWIVMLIRCGIVQCALECAVQIVHMRGESGNVATI